MEVRIPYSAIPCFTCKPEDSLFVTLYEIEKDMPLFSLFRVSKTSTFDFPLTLLTDDNNGSDENVYVCKLKFDSDVVYNWRIITPKNSISSIRFVLHSLSSSSSSYIGKELTCSEVEDFFTEDHPYLQCANLFDEVFLHIKLKPSLVKTIFSLQAQEEDVPIEMRYHIAFKNLNQFKLTLIPSINEHI